MEDSYQTVQDMMIENDIPYTYYAVFDGHGGADCALYLRNNLHHELKRCLSDSLDGVVDVKIESEEFNERIKGCIVRAFAETDEKYKLKHPSIANQCGATAVVCLVIGNKLICANVGDARAVLCRNAKALDLSVDHKAVSYLICKMHFQSREDEQERIKKQGGYIVFGRVLGRLAVTRAFGDFDCKNIEVPNDDNTKDIKNFVLVEPEVTIALIYTVYLDKHQYN